jgi:hypothetical protein
MCCQRPHQPRGPQASPLAGIFLPLGTEVHVTAAAIYAELRASSWPAAGSASCAGSRSAPGPGRATVGDVHPKHLASHRSARGFARGLPGAAPNVQHTFGTADARRRAEAVVQPARFGIVVIGDCQGHSGTVTCSTIGMSGYSTNWSRNISSATRPTRAVPYNGRGSEVAHQGRETLTCRGQRIRPKPEPSASAEPYAQLTVTIHEYR